LIFRMSMLGNAPLGVIWNGWYEMRGSDRPRELLYGGSHRQLVTERTQAGDDTDRYVGKVRVVPKCFARLRVRKVYLHELQAYPEQSVAQGDAGMRERAGIEYEKADASGRGPVDAADQLGFRVALKGHQLVAGFPGQLRRALFDRLESVRSVDPGLTTAEQVQIGSV